MRRKKHETLSGKVVVEWIAENEKDREILDEMRKNGRLAPPMKLKEIDPEEMDAIIRARELGKRLYDPETGERKKIVDPRTGELI